MRQHHDTSYKQLFSHPEVVRDLVLGFIPDQWLHSLDFSTLEKVPGSFVTEDLRNRSSDVVWRVRVGGQWIYLYLLIEFQSRSDRWMSVRMMTYVGLLYQDLIRRGDVAGQNKASITQLPPVLPIVIYNGEKRWAAATEIADLVPKVPGMVANYLPRMQYLLIDESQQALRDDMPTLQNLMAAIVRIEHPANAESLVQVIDQLETWLDYNSEIRRTLAVWIRSVILRKSKQRLSLPTVTDLKELKMTVGNRYEQWMEEWKQQGLKQGIEEGLQKGIEEGIEKGIEKGIQRGIEKGIQRGIEEGIERGIEKGVQKGEALLLQRLLARRFGPLPAPVLQRIANAGTTELELWGDRVLDAASLNDVFA